MTDEYQNAVKKLMEYLNDTVAFAKDQMPDIAKELLAYGFYQDCLWLGIFSVVIILGIAIFLNGSSDNGEGRMFGGSVLMLAGVLLIGVAINDIVKIKTAPKLYILDELASRIKHETK